MKVLLSTLAINDPNYGNYTIPIFKNYAKKYNFDFYIHKELNNKTNRLHYEKFEIIRKFLNSNYDLLIYLDLDILIKNNCDNILDYYEINNNEVLAVRDMNVHDITPVTNYYNSGVLIFNKISAKTIIDNFNESKKFPYEPIKLLIFDKLQNTTISTNGEQHYFNLLFKKLKVKEMNNNWNYAPNDYNKMKEKNFIHLINPDTKLKFINDKNYRNKLFKLMGY